MDMAFKHTHPPMTRYYLCSLSWHIFAPIASTTFWEKSQGPNVALAAVDLGLAGLDYPSILHDFTSAAISLFARIGNLHSCRCGHLRHLLAGHRLDWLAVDGALADVWSLPMPHVRSLAMRK